MPIQKVFRGKSPVKVWTNDIDERAIHQLEEMAFLPFIHKHIAVMPDVHWGMGATIGSVIPSKGAIVPAAVGVDIGCGMIAVQISLNASDLPDNLHTIRGLIEHKVPHGRTNNGQTGDFGAHAALEGPLMERWMNLDQRYRKICAKHPKAKGYNSWQHMGTLGTGNHFIEICLDEDDHVWIVLHSGSRGAGNKIGTYFIEKAKEEMERWHITEYLPNKDLAYLVENTDLFDDYIHAVRWAQDFAEQNRLGMMDAILGILREKFPPFEIVAEAINCHHNYIAKENHYKANVWVTRKGAIRARVGDWGIIPGSMGARTYIVRGKGESESFCSCSHGAGRTMSRGEARRRFTADDLAKQTQGIDCPKDDARVDEIPAAYKNIDEVMANQSDLVEVMHTLHQIVNIKG
jgi:tRNA-splicing ligase RtcB